MPEWGEELRQRHAKCANYAGEGVDGDAALAPLDITHVVAMNPRAVSEGFLGEPALGAELSYPLPNGQL
jgi:hypothetical protein